MKIQPDVIPAIGEMYRLYFDHPEGIGDLFISVYLHIHRRQVTRYRLQMPGVYMVERGRYSCAPSPYQIEMAQVILRRAELEQRKRTL